MNDKSRRLVAVVVRDEYERFTSAVEETLAGSALRNETLANVEAALANEAKSLLTRVLATLARWEGEDPTNESR